MSALRDALLAAIAGLFLPGIVCVSIGLGVVGANLEEIRALPDTYGRLAVLMVVLWVGCSALTFAGLRGRLETATRLVVVLGVNIMIWDGFRGLWLSSWLLVALVVLVELAAFAAIWVGLRRVQIRTLLGYSAAFAVLQVFGLSIMHIQSVGLGTVGNAIRELLVVARTRETPHPQPWDHLPEGTTELARPALAPVALTESSRVESADDGAIRVTAKANPGAHLVGIPLGLDSPLEAPAVAELEIQLDEGSVGVGLLHPVTGQWFYRLEDIGGAPGRHTVYVPVYQDAADAQIIVFNARVGKAVARFEIEGLGLHGLPGAIGAVAGETKGNVYQVLLDEATRQDFEELLDQRPEYRHEGLIEFTNFATGSGRTRYSLPQILSGSFYQPARDLSAANWIDGAFSDGIFSTLERGGVPVYQYAVLQNHCDPRSSYCLSSQDYRRELLNQISDDFVTDLAFLRLLPNSVRAVLIGSIGREKPAINTWEVGFSVTTLLAGPPPVSSEDAILREYYYSLNLFAVNFFKRLLVEEVRRPASGQYVFIHAMIPHAPWARDANCNFIPADQRTNENAGERVKGQTLCSLELVRWLVEQLRLLGRYDDSLIIVHSDHGFPRPPEGQEDFNHNKVDSAEWPSWLVESLSAGTLLVKWPGARGFAKSDLPVQTIDLAPTVLEHVGIDLPPSVTGAPLQRITDDFDRAPEFAATNPSVRTRTLLGMTVDYFSRYVKEDGVWTFRENLPANP